MNKKIIFIFIMISTICSMLYTDITEMITMVSDLDKNIIELEGEYKELFINDF